MEEDDTGSSYLQPGESYPSASEQQGGNPKREKRKRDDCPSDLDVGMKKPRVQDETPKREKRKRDHWPPDQELGIKKLRT